MTTSPSAASGPYTARDIRSLYPSITDNHLRYLEKWGLVRADAPRGERLFSFSDLLTIKQVAADLENGAAPRAKVVSLSERKEQNSVSAAAAISPGASASCGASLEAYAGSDPQRA